jgi:hypothetical protein
MDRVRCIDFGTVQAPGATGRLRAADIVIAQPPGGVNAAGVPVIDTHAWERVR